MASESIKPTCPVCKKKLKSKHGLTIHIGRAHPKEKPDKISLTFKLDRREHADWKKKATEGQTSISTFVKDTVRDKIFLSEETSTHAQLVQEQEKYKKRNEKLERLITLLLPLANREKQEATLHEKFKQNNLEGLADVYEEKYLDYLEEQAQRAYSEEAITDRLWDDLTEKEQEKVKSLAYKENMSIIEAIKEAKNGKARKKR